MIELPSTFFLTSGKGLASTVINSFDHALFNSEMRTYSLLKISSILPPGCCKNKIIDLPPGSIVKTAYTAITDKYPGYISSAIGVSIPKNNQDIGLIMEHSHKGKKCGAEEIVRKMLVEANSLRQIELISIEMLSIEIHIQSYSEMYYTTFAAVALW
jgi:arginine decarboxylase